jgi:hypothetical protein
MSVGRGQRDKEMIVPTTLSVDPFIPWSHPGVDWPYKEVEFFPQGPLSFFFNFFYFKGRKKDFGKVMGVFLRIIRP